MPVVAFATELLFFTDLWILLYTQLLHLLNAKFPASVGAEYFFPSLLAPEPFEIPLYLILSFLTVLVIFLFYRLSAKKRVKKLLIFTILSLIFIWNIGDYPLQGQASFLPYPINSDTAILILFAYLFSVASIIFLGRILSRYPFILLLSVVALVAIFTFEPKFPATPHEFAYSFGPIYEIAKGKTIFSQVSSQYGLLSILALGYLAKFHLFNPFYLPHLTWLLYILQYFLCFYLIYKISKSGILALLGLFSILTINYFSLFDFPNATPQIGPMRWLPLILSLFFLYKFKSFYAKKFILLLSLLLFWNIDSGISLLLAYLFSLFILTVINIKNLTSTVKSLVLLSIGTLGIFLILNVVNLALGYHSIDIVSATSRLRQFAIAGANMIPIPDQTYFWLVILIYLASIIYFFRKQTIDDRRSKVEFEDRELRIENQPSTFQPQSLSSTIYHPSSILLFSANLSLFASVYFVGRSHPHNLFNIAMFPLLNSFILIGIIMKNKLRFIFYVSCFIVFIVFPAFQRKEAMATMIKANLDKLPAANIFKPELEERVSRYYLPETQLIKQNFPEEEILLLSMDDSYLLYLANKSSVLLDNPQLGSGILAKSDLDNVLKKAVQSCPKKIAATCTLFNRCSRYETFNNWQIDVQKLLLNSLEKSCRIKYQPVKCTNKICVAIGWNVFGPQR